MLTGGGCYAAANKDGFANLHVLLCVCVCVRIFTRAHERIHTRARALIHALVYKHSAKDSTPGIYEREMADLDSLDIKVPAFRP